MSQALKMVEEFFQAMNRYDLEGMARLLDEQVVAREVAEPEPCRGVEAFKASYRELFQGYPDCRCRVLATYDAGDDVISEVIWSATNSGRFRGSEPSGKPVELRIAYFFKFREGRIIHITEYYDLATLLVQQGQLEL